MHKYKEDTKKGLAIILLIYITLLSCNKKKELGCEDCKSNPNFKIVNINFSKLESTFKVYYDSSKINSNDFYYKNENDFSVFKEILNDFDIPFKNTTQIISLSLFTSEEIIDNFKITKNSVKGALVFFKIDDKLFTNYFSKLNWKFTLIKEFSLESSFVAASDIKDMCNYSLLDFKKRSSISFIDFSNIPKQIKYLKPFQITLNNLMRPQGQTLVANGTPHHCNTAICGSDAVGYCTAQESQSGGENWFCVPIVFDDEDPWCEKARLDANFNGEEIDMETQNTTLRSFRNNFLMNSSNGISYIQNYYYLSSKINTTADLVYSVQAMNVLINDILPIINKINTAPNGTQILISNTSAAKIVSLLLVIKGKLSDSYDLDLIDEIIVDVNHFKNRPINEVIDEFGN